MKTSGYKSLSKYRRKKKGVGPRDGGGNKTNKRRVWHAASTYPAVSAAVVQTAPVASSHDWLWPNGCSLDGGDKKFWDWRNQQNLRDWEGAIPIPLKGKYQLN